MNDKNYKSNDVNNKICRSCESSFIEQQKKNAIKVTVLFYTNFNIAKDCLKSQVTATDIVAKTTVRDRRNICQPSIFKLCYYSTRSRSESSRHQVDLTKRRKRRPYRRCNKSGKNSVTIFLLKFYIDRLSPITIIAKVIRK